MWFVGGSNPLKGDLLVIAGSTLYAISNVSEVCNFNLFICWQLAWISDSWAFP